MLTIDRYLSSDDKYPYRVKSPEITEDYKNNAVILLDKVNQLLQELDIVDIVKISSGFRTIADNIKIGGSKNSLHCKCSAIDLVDNGNVIYKMIEQKPELLKKYGLWMEHKDNTPNWVHWDIGNRSDRDIRIFRP